MPCDCSPSNYPDPENPMYGDMCLDCGQPIMWSWLKDSSHLFDKKQIRIKQMESRKDSPIVVHDGILGDTEDVPMDYLVFFGHKGNSSKDAKESHNIQEVTFRTKDGKFFSIPMDKLVIFIKYGSMLHDKQYLKTGCIEKSFIIE